MNIHKNARLTRLRREEMALSVIEGRLSQALAARTFADSESRRMSRRERLFQQPAKAFCWSRPTYMEALRLINVKSPEQFHLVLAFHAFNENFRTAVSQQSDNVPEHSSATWREAVMQERAVDLHHIEVD